MVMKACCLFIASFLFTWQCLFGEIRNGYELEINQVKASLKSLQDLLSRDASLTFTQRSEMKTSIDKLIAYISYYELTEGLLAQFRTIAPDLYQEIETLTDGTGHKVTVYVRFASEQEMQHGASGTTNIAHLESDKTIYTSEYGPYTVSIKIASVNKALLLLAHEFGHAKYQVPNLATYFVYYSVYYQNGTFRSSYIGHNSNDASGRQALIYENAFRERYTRFLRTTTDKLGTPVALLQEIRKAISLGSNSL
jgi:hypothetical protein